MKVIGKILLCSSLLLLLCNIESNAQIHIGLKSAYYISFNKSSEIKYDDNLDFLTYKIRFIEEDISPVIGIFASYQNDLVYLRADIAIRSIQTRFSYINYLTFDDLRPHESIKKTKSIILPFEAGLLVQNFKFGLGPTIEIHYSQNNVFENIPDFDERRRDINMGFHISSSISINQLQLEFLYEKRFHGVGDYFYYRGDQKSFQQASQYVSIGLSYLLPIN